MAMLKKDFAWGSGAEVSFVDVLGNNWAGSNAEGFTDEKGNIQISKKFLDLLASAKIKEDQEAALFIIIETLLHEENHRGRDLVGTKYKAEDPNETNEPGDAFFYEVYGRYATGSGFMDFTTLFDDPKWQENKIEGAKNIMAAKRNAKQEKDLPNWDQAFQWLRHAVFLYPNIEVKVISNLED
jgi:hypothetical protein